MPDINAYSRALSDPRFASRQVQWSDDGALVHRSRSFKELFVLNKDTKDQNAQLAGDFRRALAAKYGSKIAECVFAKHIGKPGARHEKAISADQLRKALSMAETAKAFVERITDTYGALKGERMFEKHIVHGRGNTPGVERLMQKSARELERESPPRGSIGQRMGAILKASAPYRKVEVDGRNAVLTEINETLAQGRRLARTPPRPWSDPAEFQREVKQFQNQAGRMIDWMERVEDDIQDFRGEPAAMAKAANHAEALRALINEISPVVDRLNMDLTRQSAAVPEARSAWQLTQKAADQFTRTWTQAALNMIEGIFEPVPETPFSEPVRDRAVNEFDDDADLPPYQPLLKEYVQDQPPVRHALEAVRNMVDSIDERLLQNETTPLQPSEFAEKITGVEQDMVRLLRQAYQEAGQPDPGVKGVKKLLRDAWVQVMNSAEWPPIVKEFTVPYLGWERTLRTTITPAGSLPGVDNHKRLFPTYNGGGVCSATIGEATHAVNLASTSIAVEDSAGQSRTFVGLRHGIHSATGIADGAARRAANRNRAMETALAALALKLERNPDLEEPIELNLTSISLVSPDFFRRGEADEAKMLREQTQAWRDLMAEAKGTPPTITLWLNNESVEVALNIATLNYGVNAGAMHWYGSPQGIWTNSERLNASETGMDAFLSRVHHFINRNLKHPNRDVVITLRDQIARILEEKSYKSMGSEPYKLVARLAVISSLMDDIPLWNCKNGTDRSGQMDVEAKFLFAKIIITGTVPEPDAELSADDMELVRRIALEGGNFEVQVMNTGMPGFKLENVPVNYDRMGGTELVRDIHAGGSHFLKA